MPKKTGGASAAEIAKRINVDPSTAARWLKDPGFPADGTDESIRDWRRHKRSKATRRLAHRANPSPRGRGKAVVPPADAQAPRSDLPFGMSVAERDLIAANLRIKQAQATERELDLAVKEGRYVLREEQEKRDAQNLGAVKRALLEIGRRIAPLCEGQTSRRIRALWDEAVLDALRCWSGADE